MTDERDILILLRLLHGEATPEERRRTEARLAAEPELRAARERLERTWDGLELPAGEAPPGFAAGVLERLPAGEPATPVWARLAAAAALVAGIALGAGIGRVAPGDELADALDSPPPATLAEFYLDALADLDEGVGE